MDVLYIRSNSFKNALKGNNTLQQKIALVHNEYGTRIAIDSTEAIWAHYKNNYETPTFSKTVKYIRELGGNGTTPMLIGLQSILSKPTPDGQPYAMSWRILDVVEFFKQVTPDLPGVQIGIIDALPSHNKDYQTAYSDLKDALAAEGFALGFIHLDMPFSYPRRGTNGASWAKMVAVGEYVQGVIGTEFGLVCTDNIGGTSSNNLYRQYVLDGIERYIEAGGNADHYILMSWYPYPDATAPDDIVPIPPGEATQLRVFREMVSLANPYGRPDMEEFALLSQYWMADCGDVDDCIAVDFYIDGTIDFFDLYQLALNWLGEEVMYIIRPSHWQFDEQSGSLAADSIGENHGEN
jgi:hypothetical protein